jgi:glucose repression regulatory protein TUP1
MLLFLCSNFAEDMTKEGDLYIRSVCFSPDNKYLAAGAEDKTVRVCSHRHYNYFMI